MFDLHINLQREWDSTPALLAGNTTSADPSQVDNNVWSKGDIEQWVCSHIEIDFLMVQIAIRNRLYGWMVFTY